MAINYILALRGFYTAYFGSCLPTFRNILTVPSSKGQVVNCLILEEGADRLSRNVGKQLSTHAAEQPRTANTSILSTRKKSEIEQRRALCTC